MVYREVNIKFPTVVIWKEMLACDNLIQSRIGDMIIKAQKDVEIHKFRMNFVAKYLKNTIMYIF